MMNWIVSSTILIIVIIELRFLLKGKISLRLQYGLWAIVMIRLLLPVSIGETVMSVGNWMEQFSQKEEMQEVYEFTQVKLPEKSYQQAYQEVVKQYESQGIDITTMPEAEFAETIEYEVQEAMKGEVSLADIAKNIWLIGGIVVGLWFIYTNILFQQSVSKARKEFLLDFDFRESSRNEYSKKLRIYVCDVVDTPCLFGVFRPAIYVTSDVAKDEKVLWHVIAHEMTHYLHRDYIWSYLRALCLAIHWYNPFVWCAAILSREDAELACDEATIMQLGEAERVAYGHTLIGLTCEKRSTVLLTATTMTGSGKTIKERISRIVKKPKMKMYTFVAVVIVTIICVGCTFTGAKNAETNRTEQEVSTEEQEESEQTETEDGGLTGIDSLTNEKVLFYDALSEDMRITDTEVNGRILQLLLDENQLIDTIAWQCEIDLEERIEVDGCPYYRVLEADSWAYYERLAKNYYSEEFFTHDFIGTYAQMFVEQDGKLYRVSAEAEVPDYAEDSLQVWKTDETTYYATLKSLYSGGWFETRGYELRLSENSVYGFEIVDKPYVHTRAKDFIYYADLTHDGIDERVHVYITGESGQENSEIRILVCDEETLDVLSIRVIRPREKLGQWYYLNTYNGQDYFMIKEINRTTKETIYSYEVFYLGENGEHIVYDSDEVDVSPATVAEWKSFAEQTNHYFDGGTLLLGASGLQFEYSTNISTHPYYEGLMWLLHKDNLEYVAENLDAFLEGILDD